MAAADVAGAVEAGFDRDGPFVVDVETDPGALEPPVCMHEDGE